MLPYLLLAATVPSDRCRQQADRVLRTTARAWDLAWPSVPSPRMHPFARRGRPRAAAGAPRR